VPASCAECGKVELLPENEDAIELVMRFPSLIKQDGVDLRSAITILDELGYESKAEMLEKLEAIFRGIRGRGSKR